MKLLCKVDNFFIRFLVIDSKTDVLNCERGFESDANVERKKEDEN